MKKCIFITVLLSGLISSARGGVLYWNQPTSPAEIALSTAVLSLIPEPQGLSLNPSLLPGVKWKSVNSSGVLWPLDIYGGSVSGVFPLARSGAAAAGISYWNYGQLNAYDRMGNQTGTINPQALALLLGYGRRIYGSLSGGINLKGSRSSVQDNSDYSWGADLALNYDFKTAQAGLLLRDLGPRYPVNDTLRFKMLRTISAGVRKAFFRDQLAVGLQLDATETRKWHPVLGIEFNPLQALTLRLGYDGDDSRPERSRLGLGLAFRQTGKQDYTLEYGYRSWGRLGTVQALALIISF